MNLRRRDQHLAAHVAALLLAGELVLEVHARGAGFDHRLHQLEGVERAAEAGLGVGDDRRELVDRRLALRRAGSGRRGGSALLMRSHHGRHAVDRDTGSGRDTSARRVGVGRDLPAAEVDGLQTGLDHLHGLVAGEAPERGDVGLGVQQAPEPLGAAAAPGCARCAPSRAARSTSSAV